MCVSMSLEKIPIPKPRTVLVMKITSSMTDLYRSSIIIILTPKLSKDQRLILFQQVGKGLSFYKCLLWELITTSRIGPHLLRLTEVSNQARRD